MRVLGTSEINIISFPDHGAEATQHLKAFIGDHYHFSNKPVFKTLWENYNKCLVSRSSSSSVVGRIPDFAPHPPQFVEDEGDVLFYRDKAGRAVLRPADQYRVSVSKSKN